MYALSDFLIISGVDSKIQSLEQKSQSLETEKQKAVHYEDNEK